MPSTLSECIAELTKYPGLHVKRFVTGVQTDATGAYVGVAAGADAKRQLVSTDLANLNVAGDGTDVDASWYQGAYAWLTASGLQRQVARDGYDAAAAASSATDQGSSTERVGVLTLSRTTGSAQLANLSGELHDPFPPMTDDDRKTSLRSWINQALTVMRFRVTVQVAAVESSLRYSLSSNTWIRSEDDLIGVRDRELLADQDAGSVPGDAYLRFDGAVPYLILGQAVLGGATFYADFWRRRVTWIGVHGAAYATSAVGLVNTDDVTTGQADEIAAVAYALIADDMSIREGQGTDSSWALRRAMVEERVRPYLNWGQGRTRRPRPVSVAAISAGASVSSSRRRWG